MDQEMNALKSLSDSLVKIGQSNHHADCTFIIVSSSNIRRFPCHKLIFSCASVVFDRMLFGDYSEANSGQVRLDDVDPDVFEKFRDYLYGYDVHKLANYDFKTLIQLCELGNKYLVRTIEEECKQVLIDRKDTCRKEELLTLFQYAHRLNEQSTSIQLIGIILKIKFSSRLNYLDVLEFNADVFKAYVRLIDGIKPESERFHLVEMYLQHSGIHCPNATESVEDSPSDNRGTEQLKEKSSSNLINDEEKQEYISGLIGLINFNQFTPEDFHEGPGQSNFLTLAQKYEYMYGIAQNKESYLESDYE